MKPAVINRTCLLDIKSVSKSFPLASGNSIEVLREISLSIYSGEIVSVIGRSGSGKSTLGHLAAGLLRPDSGTVTSHSGQPAHLIFQEFNRSLFPFLNVSQNVSFYLQNRNLDTHTKGEIVAQALDKVGLADFADSPVQKLSGGMKQRVSIARLLASENPVSCMDEPFSALDVITQAELEDEMIAIARSNRIGVLLITHNIDSAIFCSERVLVLSPSTPEPVSLVEIALEPERTRAVTPYTTEYVHYKKHLTSLLTEN